MPRDPDPFATAGVHDASGSVTDWSATGTPSATARALADADDEALESTSGGAEVSMIELQSLVSQRQVAVEMTTNLIGSLNESTKSIAGNIGGGGPPPAPAAVGTHLHDDTVAGRWAHDPLDPSGEPPPDLGLRPEAILVPDQPNPVLDPDDLLLVEEQQLAPGPGPGPAAGAAGAGAPLGGTADFGHGAGTASALATARGPSVDLGSPAEDAFGQGELVSAVGLDADFDATVPDTVGDPALLAQPGDHPAPLDQWADAVVDDGPLDLVGDSPHADLFDVSVAGADPSVTPDLATSAPPGYSADDLTIDL